MWGGLAYRDGETIWMKILVVEDDAGIRALLALRLSMDLPNAQVIEAEHGDEALRVCKDIRPDALIVDGHMPGMTGDALGIALRALVPNAKIISFTGMAGEVEWADAQVVKASNGALEKVIEAVRAESEEE